MSERHLRQPRLAQSACGPFTKNKERIKIKSKKQEIRDTFIKKN